MSNELIIKENSEVKWSPEALTLLKNSVCKGATDEEFELFLHLCKRSKLDPFARQIYSIKYGAQRMTITGIDGFRLIADRTGKYMPGREPTYVYNDKNQLVSATAYVKKQDREGTWHEVSASAFFKEFEGQNLWKKMPHVMLAKVAEAICIRRCFPADLSGIYTTDEMEQAEKEKKHKTQGSSETPILEAEVVTLTDSECPLTEEQIGQFYAAWDDEKDLMKEYVNAIAKYYKYTEAKAIELLCKDEDTTFKKFEAWKAKREVKKT